MVAHDAAHAAPVHAHKAAHGEEACARWHISKNVLALSENSVNTTRIISIDNDFVMKPSDLSPLYNGKALDLPRMSRRGERWH